MTERPCSCCFLWYVTWLDCKSYQVLCRCLDKLTLVYLVRAGFGVISASHHLLCFEPIFLPCSVFLITSFSGLMEKSPWKAKSALDGPWSSLLPYSVYLCIASFLVVFMALFWLFFQKHLMKWWDLIELVLLGAMPQDCRYCACEAGVVWRSCQTRVSCLLSKKKG